MAYRVVFSPEAAAELDRLLTWMAPLAGVEAAFGFVEGLRRYCLGLADFPRRGRRRDDLRPELRTLGYRRQALIAFHIADATVVVDHVLYGGRDLAPLFGDENEA